MEDKPEDKSADQEKKQPESIRKKHHAHRRRVGMTTGFALGVLAAAGAVALILFFPHVAVLGVIAKAITAHHISAGAIITGASLVTGLFGGKVGSTAVSKRIEKEERTLERDSEKAIESIRKNAITEIKNDAKILEDIVEGKEKKVEKAVMGKHTGKYMSETQSPAIGAGR